MSLNTLSEQNKEFIAKLYSLKAGLSMISLEADKIKSAEAEIADAKNHEQKTEYDLNSANQSLQYVKKQAESDRRHRDDLKKKRITKNIVGGVLLAISAFTMISMPVVMMITNILLDVMGNKNIFAGAGPMIAMVFLSMATAIPALLLIKFFKPKEERYWEKEYEEKTVVVNECVLKCKQAENDLALTRAAVQAITVKCNSVVLESTDTAMAVYNSLLETYNDTLDINNWSGIDYIIYAYITGRADNLSDALRFLDEERRYEGIVAAIDRASAQIATTINQAFADLSYHITKNFESLENTIKKNTSTIVSSINSLSSDVRGVSSSVESLGNGIAMQSALQKKSNENTKRLAEDMDYIVTKSRSGS